MSKTRRGISASPLVAAWLLGMNWRTNWSAWANAYVVAPALRTFADAYAGQA